MSTLLLDSNATAATIAARAAAIVPADVLGLSVVNGVVTIEFSPAASQQSMQAAQTALNAFLATQPLAPVPASVTRRQYYMQGVVAGWFTQAQALALITAGTLPPSVITFVSSLPVGQQFAANMYLIGEMNYYRNNPLLNQLVTAGGITQTFMDSFFIAAALL